VVTLRKMDGSGEKIFHFQVFNDLVPELIVITLAKLFGRKVVLTVHDVSSLAGPVSWRRNATGWAYRLADQVIVHNRISRLELEGLGFPSAKISVLPHGHYLDSMREMPPGADARRALEIDPTAKVVLFFGQIRDAKGLDLLIQALPEIAREVPEVVLLIAGRPWRTEFSHYDALIDELDVREQCRLHIAFIPDEQVAGYYAAADVVALPYRRIYQSGVLMMAMTYGRSVIVSDLPGMTEVITDGVNGYVFSQGSKDELAKTVIRALQDGAERERVSLRASAYIREHHDWTRIGHQTAELYEAVLAGSALP
jgi:glycosyltransferase involved in cell wall biosynthesis